MTAPRILVAGIGNIFMGDDAFGSEVAQKLLCRAQSDNVRIVDFGIRGIDLIYALLENYDAAILIDAVPRGDEPPGTLFIMEPQLTSFDSSSPSMIDAHSLDPVQVLAAAASMGADIKQLFVVGCQPEALTEEQPDGSMGMSLPVQSSIAPAVQMIEELIERISKQKVNCTTSEVHTWSQ